MLETLKIKNLAVIDEAEIPFRKGLNILSGETGAGKSIVIEAIGLLLGGRANADLIRAERDEAVIEGFFSMKEIPWMRKRLEKLGFSSDGEDLLIKRVVSRSGRHRAYVNGELATVSILAELGEGLIDLCGQHEHQSLVRPQTQMELIDRYGGLEEQANVLSGKISELRGIRADLEALRSSAAERMSRRDFLQFQLNELREAKLRPGEDVELQAEKKLLQSVEQRLQLATAVKDCLDGSDDGSGGAFERLRASASKLKALLAIDPEISVLVDSVNRSIAEAEEASLSLSRYVESCGGDPEKLEQVQERLAQLADLRRKYGSSVEEMIQTLNRVESEFLGIENSGEQIQKLERDLVSIGSELSKSGEKLSQNRKKVAKLFGQSVTAELHELSMEEAAFEVELPFKEDLQAWTQALGPNEISFIVRTNRGEAAHPIGKIASGGELSRLMLGIRRVISDKGGIGVYLFDEIDAGIGGQTAIQVGKKLRSVAAYNQVICITHLPQVASFADHHLSVRKSTKGNRTLTEIVDLQGADRTRELERMMGGPQMKTQMKKLLSETRSSSSR